MRLRGLGSLASHEWQREQRGQSGRVQLVHGRESWMVGVVFIRLTANYQVDSRLSTNYVKKILFALLPHNYLGDIRHEPTHAASYI